MSPFAKGWNKKDKKSSETKIPEVKKEEVVATVASPIIKAFYIEKEKGVWRFIMADLQDDKVIAKKVKECDNKAIALENFKIQFAMTYFFGK
jgi:hypothetical protein